MEFADRLLDVVVQCCVAITVMLIGRELARRRRRKTIERQRPLRRRITVNMTKEQLLNWLNAMASLCSGLSRWMFGPLSFAKQYLTQGAAFFKALTANDFIVELILMLINQGKLDMPWNFAQLPDSQELAMLSAPDGQNLAAFREAASTQDPQSA